MAFRCSSSAALVWALFRLLEHVLRALELLSGGRGLEFAAVELFDLEALDPSVALLAQGRGRLLLNSLHIVLGVNPGVELVVVLGEQGRS